MEKDGKYKLSRGVKRKSSCDVEEKLTFWGGAQWFKPLVNNGQNLKEFEYRDVVYVYRGFRP